MKDLVIVGDVRSDLAKLCSDYQIIVADPPWWYSSRRLIRKDSGKPTCGIGAELHYDLLKTEDLCALPIRDILGKECLLFLWATCPLLPDALQVMDSWGFEYATVGFVWVKLNSANWARESTWRSWVQEIIGYLPMKLETLRKVLDIIMFFGPGAYTGSNIELVLLGRRKGAKAIHHERGRKASQVIFAPRREHSAKPEEMQDRIEWMYPQAVPRLELFARRPRTGWDVFGLEADGRERC